MAESTGIEYGSADVSIEDIEKMQQASQEQSQNQETSQPEVADWLQQMEGLTDEQRSSLSKFKNPQDAMQAYLQLQSKLGQQTQKPAQQEAEKETPIDLTKKPDVPDAADIDNIDVSAALESAGLDISEVTNQWNTEGKLTDDQYAAIKKAHPTIGKMMANTIAEGLSARAQIHNSNITQYAGGKEQLSKIVEWARTNIPESERIQMQEMLASNKPWKMVIDSIKAKYAASGGDLGDNTASSTVQGNNNSAINGVLPYTSHQEYQAAFDNPLYANDPAYRETVEKKLNVTPQHILMGVSNITRA